MVAPPALSRDHVQNVSAIKGSRQPLRYLVALALITLFAGACGPREQPAPAPVTLADMSIAALEMLDNDKGFLLVIEGARIDDASHLRDGSLAINETLAFDRAVAAVHAWLSARDRQDVALLVTADHECGGLRLAGAPSTPWWRWGGHTNADIRAFSDFLSPASAEFMNSRAGLNHGALHAVAVSALTGAPPVAPPALLIADGHLADLGEAIASTNTTEGELANEATGQLDSLHLAADPRGLYLGLGGKFPWTERTGCVDPPARGAAVVVLIDVDYGSGCASSWPEAPSPNGEDQAHELLHALADELPADTTFAPDLALVSIGGVKTWPDERAAQAGLRSLKTDDKGRLIRLPAAINYGDGVRRCDSANDTMTSDSAGLEAFIPWSSLRAAGALPSAEMALQVWLTDTSGETRQQTLPASDGASSRIVRTQLALELGLNSHPRVETASSVDPREDSPCPPTSDLIAALNPGCLAVADPIVSEPLPEAGPGSLVLFIGDGMGRGHIEAADAHSDTFFLTTLPLQARVQTASLSGITDSAAAATWLATGHATWNGVIGLDAECRPRRNLLELARGLGKRTGLVTTASVTDATPAAFSTHHVNRDDELAIAQSQAQDPPNILLGGGARWWRDAHGGRDGLSTALAARGCQLVSTAAELSYQSQEPVSSPCVIGLFADDDLPYTTAPEAIDPVTTVMSRELKSAQAEISDSCQPESRDDAQH